MGGVYFWQSDVSISLVWLIRNLTRNTFLYSFENPGLDHKSLNGVLSTCFNLKLNFHLPSILPEEWRNRRADIESPMVSSHWDSTRACGEVTFPWHCPQQQSGVRQKLWAWSLSPFSLCLANISLRSHGNISGVLTQGIPATEVREWKVT